MICILQISRTKSTLLQILPTLKIQIKGITSLPSRGFITKTWTTRLATRNLILQIKKKTLNSHNLNYNNKRSSSMTFTRRSWRSETTLCCTCVRKCRTWSPRLSCFEISRIRARPLAYNQLYTRTLAHSLILIYNQTIMVERQSRRAPMSCQILTELMLKNRTWTLNWMTHLIMMKTLQDLLKKNPSITTAEAGAKVTTHQRAKSPSKE